MKLSRRLFMGAGTSFLSVVVFAQDLLPVTSPEQVGFSSERLNRVGQVLQSDVDQGDIPGAVLLIARRGKIAYLREFGYQDRGKQVPLKTNSIFRIASMTKPITSTAMMMLAEEGKIDITL